VTRRPVIARDAAIRDVTEAVDHDAAEAGETVALRFIAAVEGSFARLSRHPAMGSPRHGHELGIPACDAGPCRAFPT
jgi:toxin ParE1/3/4